MQKSLTRMVMSAAFLMMGAALAACQSSTPPAMQSTTQMSNANDAPQHQARDNRDIGNGAYGESVP